MTSGVFALSMMGGCGKTGQAEGSSGDKSQNASQETSQEADGSANAGKPLTMEDKDRLLSLEELQKYSNKYTISNHMDDYGEGELIIDGYGNVSVGPCVSNIYVDQIKDICSDEVIYYKETYVTLGERETVEGEDYSYYIDRSLPHSRLYDKDGNLVCDWQDVDYDRCFSDWITTYNYSYDTTYEAPSDARTTVTNVKNGQTLEGISDIGYINDDKASLLDGDGNIIGVIDREGNRCFENVLQDMPKTGFYMSQKNGYYYTTINDEEAQRYECSFYDVDGKELVTFTEKEYIEFYRPNSVGPYIIASVGSKDKVLDLRGDGKGGKKVLYEAQHVTYYDGERIIADHNGDEQYGLFDAEGKQLASFKGEIFPENVTSDSRFFDECNHLEKTETFLAIDGNVIKRVDRDGKELASFQVPTSENSGIYIEIYDDAVVYNTGDFSHAGILSRELEEMIPCKGYYESYAIVDGVTGKHYFYASYDENGKKVESLYTMTGELVLLNSGRTSSLSDGKMAVCSGKYFGIRDLNGQWIYKYSIIDYMDQWM